MRLTNGMTVEQAEQAIADLLVTLVRDKLKDFSMSEAAAEIGAEWSNSSDLRACGAVAVGSREELEKIAEKIAYQIKRQLDWAPAGKSRIVSRKLELPQGVDMKANAFKDGLWLRMVRDYDVASDLVLMRVDVSYAVL